MGVRADVELLDPGLRVYEALGGEPMNCGAVYIGQDSTEASMKEVEAFAIRQARGHQIGDDNGVGRCLCDSAGAGEIPGLLQGRFDSFQVDRFVGHRYERLCGQFAVSKIDGMIRMHESQQVRFSISVERSHSGTMSSHIG
jgi:hypothetical protein